MESSDIPGGMGEAMKPILIISAIAIVYALIRAKHDSYINDGPWKKWAFWEGVFFDLVVVLFTIIVFQIAWFHVFMMALSFAFVFWIVFDAACGWHRARNILYIGTTGFDARMRRMTQYKKGYLFLGGKLFFAFVIIAGTISLINEYG